MRAYKVQTAKLTSSTKLLILMTRPVQNAQISDVTGVEKSTI